MASRDGNSFWSVDNRCNQTQGPPTGMVGTLLILGLLVFPSVGNGNQNMERLRTRAHANLNTHPINSLRAWFLHQALLRQTNDEEYPVDSSLTFATPQKGFRSIAWVSAAKLRICPIGLPQDSSEAGIWPLALHNLLILQSGSGRRYTGQRAAADSLARGRQVRQLNFSTPLNLEEIRNLKTVPTGCGLLERLKGLVPAARPNLTPQQLQRLQVPSVQKAQIARQLLQKSLSLTNWQWTQGREVVQARIREIDFYLSTLNTEAGSAKKLENHYRSLRVSDWAKIPDRTALHVLTSMHGKLQPELFKEVLKDRIRQKIANADTSFLDNWLSLYPQKLGPEDIWLPMGEKLLGMPESKESKEPEEPDHSDFSGRPHLALFLAAKSYENRDDSLALTYLSQSYQLASGHPEQQKLRAMTNQAMASLLANYRLDPEALQTLESLLEKKDLQPMLQKLAWSGFFLRDKATLRFLTQLKKKHGAKLQDLLGHLQKISRPDIQAFKSAKFRRFFGQFLDKLGSRSDQDLLPLLPSLRQWKKTLTGSQNFRRRTLEKHLAKLQSVLLGLEKRKIAVTSATLVDLGAVHTRTRISYYWPYKKAAVLPPNIFRPIQIEAAAKRATEKGAPAKRGTKRGDAAKGATEKRAANSTGLDLYWKLRG